MNLQVGVRILDNLNLKAMWDGYKAGDRLRCVWEMGAEIAAGCQDIKAELFLIAEDMFAIFNSDDRPNGKFAKSMSIGDVIQFNYGDGRMFLACDTIGFIEIEDPGDVPLNQDVPFANAVAMGPGNHGESLYYHDAHPSPR